MPTARDGTLRRDILSAYAASGSRVLSWVIVSALVYRRSTEAFAALGLIRGTLGILSYASLGLLPAMIRAFARAAVSEIRPAPAVAVVQAQPIPLSYVTPETTRDQIQSRRAGSDNSIQRIFATGMTIALLTTFFGAFVTGMLTHFAPSVYIPPRYVDPYQMMYLVGGLGIGTIIRWLGEPAAALLQTRQLMSLDNLISAVAEIAWVAGAAYLLRNTQAFDDLWPQEIVLPYIVSGIFLTMARGIAARASTRVSAFAHADWRLFRPLLATGLLVTIAQAADYLYSPTDYLLIDHLLPAIDLAAYTPAVQIDSGLMLLVTALGAVLLPRTALAHAAGDHGTIRRYYLRGTLASAATLLGASALIYLAAPLLFRLWLGDDMPGTRAILPLVLLNTVIGGSSAVGRAILIGMGKVKAFTIGVLLAGVTNVICSYVFVRYCGLGLRGIVLGTVVAVIARCGIWMPWYVLRQLRSH